MCNQQQFFQTAALNNNKGTIGQIFQIINTCLCNRTSLRLSQQSCWLRGSITACKHKSLFIQLIAKRLYSILWSLKLGKGKVQYVASDCVKHRHMDIKKDLWPREKMHFDGKTFSSKYVIGGKVVLSLIPRTVCCGGNNSNSRLQRSTGGVAFTTQFIHKNWFSLLCGTH